MFSFKLSQNDFSTFSLTSIHTSVERDWIDLIGDDKGAETEGSTTLESTAWVRKYTEV